MKINKIKINSYGKLKEKEIQLHDGINIVYGENESGKSTLLKFIVNSFYGISKNKKGKEYSDFDRYLPWTGEEFSGKIEYELNNKERYEVYRDFKKKNPQIFNSSKEEISKQFNIHSQKEMSSLRADKNGRRIIFINCSSIPTRSKIRKARTKYVSPKNSKFSRNRR